MSSDLVSSNLVGSDLAASERLSPPLPASRAVRVAVELPGSAARQAGSLHGVLRALAADADLQVFLVGPLDEASVRAALTAGSVQGIAAAPLVIADGAGAGARQIRAQRQAAPRLAAESLAAGTVDAVVGTSGYAVMTAALGFTSRPLSGATRPSLAALLHPGAFPGPVRVLTDTAPAQGPTGADELVQAALGATAVVDALTAGPPAPAVALLRLPPGSPDTGREQAASLLTEVLGSTVAISTAEADELLSGTVAVGAADAVAAPSWLAGVAAGRAQTGATGPVVAARLVLGFPGVAVLPEGDSATALATAIGTATAAVRGGLPASHQRSLAALREQRRASAGLGGVTVASGAAPPMTAPLGTTIEEAR